MKSRINSWKTSPLLILTAVAMTACGGSSGGGGSAASEVESNRNFCEASFDSGNYFEELGNAPAAESTESAPYVRSRTVKVDIESLRHALLKSSGKTITLPLFDGTSVQIMIESVEQPEVNNVIASGRLADDGSSASLVINGDVLMANLQVSHESRFSIRYAGNGTHTIQEFDSATQAASTEAEEDCIEVPAPDPQPTSSVGVVTEATATTQVIDMLVAYTPGAVSKVGGTTAMKALIQTGIADTNRAFLNSGVNIRVRLVGTLALKQNDTNNFSGDLDALRGKSDGRWDEVHAARTRLGADQVSVVGVYSGNGVAGIGYIGAGYGSAFSITKASAFGQYSFTHELGHNIGLQHSDGYVNYSGSFRTIMAYGSVTRILRFSNPNKTYNGFKTGDSSHYSASKLNSWGYILSGLSATKVTLANDEVPPSLTECP